MIEVNFRKFSQLVPEKMSSLLPGQFYLVCKAQSDTNFKGSCDNGGLVEMGNRPYWASTPLKYEKCEGCPAFENPKLTGQIVI